LGCRSLDIIHVASAVELERKTFLAFDERQRKLARAVGLKLLIPRKA
jgi:predicted nucleic acid-binding protein